MSRAHLSLAAGARHAAIFAALGESTRLGLLARLCEESPSSISELAKGAPISRQAITRHLGVLEKAGVVRGEMAGRVRLFELNPEALLHAKSYLERVSTHWGEALARLQAHVE